MSVWRDMYRGEQDFDFPRRWRLFITVSAALVVVSIVALFVRGLNLGIDFEGGTVIEVESPGLDVGGARDVLAPFGADDARVQTVTDPESGDEYIRIRSDVDDPARSEEIRVAFEEIGTIREFESVGPTWGEEITDKAIRALVFFFVVIALYISIRLEWKMAVGAIVAVVHDILLTVGVYSVFQFEVTPSTVIAVLTILGYSLYDTIVVYDKVHEVTGRVGATGRYTYTEMMNLSLNQVLMRSINTTFTSVLPIVSILIVGWLILGAVTLQEFGIALCVGLIAGAYSSIAIAAPVVTWLKEREPRYRQVRERVAARGGGDGDTTRRVDRETAALGVSARRVAGSGSSGSSGGSAAEPRRAPTGAIPPRPRKQKRR